MPDDVVTDPRKDKQRRKSGWPDADVRRAIQAAQDAGLGSYRVEVAPDGTISIIVGPPADTADPDTAGGV